MCNRTGGNADFTFFHDFYTKIGEYKEKKFVKYEGLYRLFLHDTIFEEGDKHESFDEKQSSKLSYHIVMRARKR